MSVAAHSDQRERSLEEVLHDRGLRITPQRQLIYRIITGQRQHITADDVQKRLAQTMPGIALPTVYATLDLFVDLGFVRKVALPGGPVLYDSGNETPHAHMLCRRCHRVYDLEIPPLTTDERQAASSVGFRADSADLVLYGICADCLRSER